MRFLFENKEKAKTMGEEGFQFMKDCFDTKTIGTIMKNRLEEIERNL